MTKRMSEDEGGVNKTPPCVSPRLLWYYDGDDGRVHQVFVCGSDDALDAADKERRTYTRTIEEVRSALGAADGANIITLAHAKASMARELIRTARALDHPEFNDPDDPLPVDGVAALVLEAWDRARVQRDKALMDIRFQREDISRLRARVVRLEAVIQEAGIPCEDVDGG